MLRVIDVMKGYVINTLSGAKLELLDADVVTRKAKDSDTEEKFFKFSVEVPRGFRELSRIRFDVKVRVKEGSTINPKEYVEGGDASIIFQNLEISYIDEHGGVYFRAEDFQVIEEA